MKKKLSYPFYLFLYPIFFVFHGFVQNFYFVTFVTGLQLTGLYLASLIIVTTFFYLLFKRIQPAALMASLIITFNFFFGYFHDFLITHFEKTFISKYIFVLFIFLIALVVFFFILKRAKDLSGITRYFNLLFTLLILIDAILLAGKTFFTSKEKTSNVYTVCNSCPKPDVYLILLDGYAGQEQLKDEFNYDNITFYNDLTTRHFKTIAKSHSNYNYTPYSTASTLNMEYLDSSNAGSNAGRRENKYVLDKIDQNNLVSFFSQNGYEFFNHSIFKVWGQAPPVSSSFINSNAGLITSNTFIARFKKNVLPNIADKLGLKSYMANLLNATNNNNKNSYKLTENAPELKSSKPKIVYTHLIMPHHPYYYNEKGELRKFSSANEIVMNDTAAYLSYLKYTNKEITHLVDAILSKSPSPPIIVLLSDHGFRYSLSDERKHVFSNLISLHIPSGNYAGYNDSLSNVNLFRVLLNNEFGQQLPLLEDKVFNISF